MLKRDLFWRPEKISTMALAGVALLAALVWGWVAAAPEITVSPTDDLIAKTAVGRLTTVFDHIAAARKTAADRKADPLATGLIGLEASPITSKWGSLPAKQSTVNPEWAAAFVSMYREAGLEAGDSVAIGMSGSFPALNLAAVVSAEAMSLKPLVLSSVLSSQWGANQPNFTWLDIEALVAKAGLIHTRSIGVSLGGLHDTADGMPEGGRELARRAIARNGLEEITHANPIVALDLRIQRIDAAADQKVVGYVNIGGGQLSLGGKRGRAFFKPGVNLPRAPQDYAELKPSLMKHYGERGLPIIHIASVKELARRYGVSNRGNRSLAPPKQAAAFFPLPNANKRMSAVVGLALIVAALLLIRYRLPHQILSR